MKTSNRRTFHEYVSNPLNRLRSMVGLLSVGPTVKLAISWKTWN
jgi:hypothetical protein